MGKALPVWTCAQTGDCCRAIGALVMTTDEAVVVRDATARPLTFMAGPQPGQVALRPTEAGACPLLGEDGRCTIYASRPMNCRRFACLRAPGEALEPGGPLGCRNAERKLSSRPHRRLLAQMERDAQKWGRAHGWTEAMR